MVWSNPPNPPGWQVAGHHLDHFENFDPIIWSRIGSKNDAAWKIDVSGFKHGVICLSR